MHACAVKRLVKWMDSVECAELYKPLLEDWGKTLWEMWGIYQEDNGSQFYAGVPAALLKMSCFSSRPNPGVDAAENPNVDEVGDVVAPTGASSPTF